MKKFLYLLPLVIILLTACAEFDFESVPGDPMQTRIYTLDNGLKVYMSVNDDEPRIQTIISVRVGSQDDPRETTGLAHYFEHIMFKGTSQFGTSDFGKEKPLLDSIELLFEQYRMLSDEAERRALYSRIDSISQEAAKYAIPNEYDKLMALIGSSGSNAWTSEDCTSYTEQIPSNQLENWARIQSERFRDPVIRGFHTELENVYEEYNMHLTSPYSKIYEKLCAMLYPNHPYGEHSVLGLQEHIKNPSITNIRKYFETFYVPNNMAICMSGDFDPDEAIGIIRKYFSVLEPNESLPKRQVLAITPRTEPVEATCYTEDSESVCIGWNTPAASSEDCLLGGIAACIMYNGYCGLLDRDLLQTQKLLSASCYHTPMASAGNIELNGEPKEGQTLEEVRQALLDEVAKLRNGDFDEKILKSTVANFRLDETKGLESNISRTITMVESFTNGIEWEDVVHSIDRISSLTKKDITDWASRYLTENGYCVVYKRQGKDTESRKIAKPAITPLPTNSQVESEFYASVRDTKVNHISPSFVDYNKDMMILETANGNEVLYKHNDTNETFEIRYVTNLGIADMPELEMALRYVDMLGTTSRTRKEINEQIYSIACSYNMYADENHTTLSVEGLAENTEQALRIVDDIVNSVKGDPTILSELKRDMIQERENDLKNNRAIRSALSRYCLYGKDAISRLTLSNAQLIKKTDEDLIRVIHDINKYKHTIMYYGPLSPMDAISLLNRARAQSSNPMTPESMVIRPVQTLHPTVTVVHYDSKQIRYEQSSVRNTDTFCREEIPGAMMFNNYYFSIVFQEMREARALAYTAYANYEEADNPEIPYTFMAAIGTQNDKMTQAIEAFDSIIEHMPESEIQFESTKNALISKIESTRTRKFRVLTSFYHARQMGLSEEWNSIAYDAIRNMTLQDLKKFHEKHIAGREYSYQIVGDTKDIDMEYLRSIGTVSVIPVREVFGY